MRKVQIILTWSSLLLFLAVTVAFSNSQRNIALCHEIDISIVQDSDLFFVNKEDVMAKMTLVNSKLIGENLDNINPEALEKAISSISEVRTAEVYKTLDGKIMVEITQRRPIARVIPRRGAGFYIDTDGKLMPLSKNYSARVLVINGNIIQKSRSVNIADLQGNDSLMALTLFDEMYQIASYIEQDNFWKAQIQQVYVDENQEFSIIPRIGNHNIELGNTSHLQEKFERLMTFYKEGLPYTNWNIYKNISLKFDNQIVCTFKDTLI